MQKITEFLLNEVLAKAENSPRRRMNHNFHPSLDAVYQRMLNCLMPDTYCQPHRHLNPAKSESFIILKGKILVLEFEDNGNIKDHFILNAANGNYGVDILPGIYHTIIALTPAVVFESKDGPYMAINDKDFASWAPKEGSSECQSFNKNILEKLHLI